MLAICSNYFYYMQLESDQREGTGLRISFHFIFLIVLLVCLERVVSLALKGELFKPGRLQESFREVGKTVWLGMRLFVFFWILYLLFLYWTQHRH